MCVSANLCGSKYVHILNLMFNKWKQTSTIKKQHTVNRINILTQNAFIWLGKKKEEEKKRPGNLISMIKLLSEVDILSCNKH